VTLNGEVEIFYLLSGKNITAPIAPERKEFITMDLLILDMTQTEYLYTKAIILSGRIKDDHY
jgi:hypothetical protein